MELQSLLRVLEGTLTVLHNYPNKSLPLLSLKNLQKTFFKRFLLDRKNKIYINFPFL